MSPSRFSGPGCCIRDRISSADAPPPAPPFAAGRPVELPSYDRPCLRPSRDIRILVHRVGLAL